MDLGLAFVLFCAFACCAGTETAITTLWPWKVREFANGERGRGQWTALREDIQRFMQTILIGATLSGVGGTALVTDICGQLFGPRGLGIAAGVVSLVQLVFGEILPKSVAVANPYSFTRTTLPVFYTLSAVVYPMSRGINQGISLLFGAFGLSVDVDKTPFVSEEELELIFRSAITSGIVDVEEGKMIRSVRDLDTHKVKEVMTPLVDMICIDATASLATLRRLCLDTQFTRIPVYSERSDWIMGVVSMKMLLRCLLDAKDTKLDEVIVEQICDKPIFVPETMTLWTALRILRERTLAICVNEYGGTSGLVTLEDVLEEIVGEIYDPDEEKDNLERAENCSKIQNLGGGRFMMSAIADVEDVSVVLGVGLPSGDYNSIGGFMCKIIDRMPVVGEVVAVSTVSMRFLFKVVQVDDRRVVTVEAECQKGDEAEDSDDEARFAEEDLLRVVDVRQVIVPTEVADGEKAEEHKAKDAEEERRLYGDEKTEQELRNGGQEFVIGDEVVEREKEEKRMEKKEERKEEETGDEKSVANDGIAQETQTKAAEEEVALAEDRKMGEEPLSGEQELRKLVMGERTAEKGKEEKKLEEKEVEEKTEENQRPTDDHCV